MIKFDENKAQLFWANKKIKTLKEDPTRHGDDKRISFDVQLIKNVIEKYDNIKKILDLGSGTGQLSAALQPIFPLSNFTLVEKNSYFTKHLKNERFHVINCDIEHFLNSEVNHFDLILLFGVINSISEDRAQYIYERLSSIILAGSYLIIKHQCGVNSEVIVDKFSIDLNAEYTARYPYINSEIKSLKKFFDLDIVDIYPNYLNKFKDTHFYAFICKKR